MKEFEDKLQKIKIEKSNNEMDIISVAKIYAEVFAGPPWNEFTKCSNCNNFFGLDTKEGMLCPNEDGILTLAYPEKETIDYINEELSNPDSIMLIGKENETNIAFTWGYSFLSPDEFVNKKYRTTQMKNKILGILNKEGVNGKFFYCSETGIIKPYRGLGLCNILFQKRLEIIKNLDIPIVSRTNCNSPMVAIAEKFKQKQIMGPQMIVDRINKKIISTGTLVNDCKDSEIEERVLFVLQ